VAPVKTILKISAEYLWKGLQYFNNQPSLPVSRTSALSHGETELSRESYEFQGMTGIGEYPPLLFVRITVIAYKFAEILFSKSS